MILLKDILEQLKGNKIKLTPIERINYKLIRRDKDFTEKDIDTITELLKQNKINWNALKDFPKDVIEKAILMSEDAYYAYVYALNNLNSKWIEAEPFIMRNSGYAYYYAKYVLKSRWKEAEPYIKESKHWWDEYRKHFNIKEN